MSSSDSRRGGAVSVGTAEVGFTDVGEQSFTGTPIVLLPGTAGRAETHFAFLLPMLAARHRVIGVDFGALAADSAELTVNDLVAQAVAVIERVVPGRRVLLVGYSLGAVAAAAVAGTRPDLVEGLILVAGWLTTDVQQLLRNSVWQTLRLEGSKALQEYMTFCAYSNPYLISRTPQELDLLPTRMEVSELLDQQMDLNRRVDISDVVERIAAPTLVIACSYDQMVPVRQSKLLFGSIDDARYTEVASGHGVVLERPAELFQLIERFAADPTAAPAGSILPAASP